MQGLRRSAFIITIFFLGVWVGNHRQLPDWAVMTFPVTGMWWFFKYDEMAYKKSDFERMKKRRGIV